MSKIFAVHQLGITSPVIRQSSFHWRIPNFKKLKSKFERLSILYEHSIEFELQPTIVDVLSSPIFSTNADDLKWSLVMFSRKKVDFISTPITYLCFEFRSKDLRFFTVDVNVTISILSHGFKKKRSFSVRRSENKTSEIRGFILDFINCRDIFTNTYLNHGQLELLCEYELIPDEANNQILTFDNHDLINQSFSHIYKKSRKDEQLNDCELSIGDRKLSASKFYLSAGSPVFAAFFSQSKQENQGKISMSINDVSYVTLQKIIGFMHSGKIENLDHASVEDMLAAAKKYQISLLEYACKEFLFKNLNVENSLITSNLCKKFGLTDLQKQVDAFIRVNANLIPKNNAPTAYDSICTSNNLRKVYLNKKLS